MKARTSGKYLFLNGEKNRSKLFNVSSVQSLTRVRLFATPWIAACQASLSITNSRSLPKLMSIGRWCHPVLFYSICNMYTLGAFSVFFFCLCMCFLLVFSIFFFFNLSSSQYLYLAQFSDVFCFIRVWAQGKGDIDNARIEDLKWDTR